MLPSFNTEIDPLRLVERPMCVESVARCYGVPARTIRWAAEHGHLRGFREPGTLKSKCWRFWRSDVQNWLRRRGLCN